MSTFTAASIIPAYEHIAEDLGVNLTRATYLTSLQIAILGGAPLFWKPLSGRFGRRPIFLLSLLCSFAGNIGCAKSPSYATLGLCRAIVAWFISPAAAIGSGVVTESFFRNERGRYMGVWTLMVTLGVPVGPFIFGFVAEHAGYRWIFWTLAIVSTISQAPARPNEDDVTDHLMYLSLGKRGPVRSLHLPGPRDTIPPRRLRRPSR